MIEGQKQEGLEGRETQIGTIKDEAKNLILDAGGQSISNGTRTIDRPAIICSLNESDLSSYPYMDTMCYVDIDNDKCSNDSDNLEGRHRYCQDTGGGWEGPGDEDADRDDYDDDDDF